MWRFVDAGVAPVVITVEKTLAQYRANLQVEKSEIAKHSAMVLVAFFVCLGFLFGCFVWFASPTSEIF